MQPTRRQFIQATMGAAAITIAPPSFHAAHGDDGYLKITASPSLKKLYRADAPESQLWTYNDTSPGPEIRAKRGERIKVRLINQLEEPTSIHWHGIRIDNAMDGVPGLTQESVPPGQTFEYDFIAPDAGTYWYHAHNKSWNQVARGLYGPLIIEEDDPAFDHEHDLTLLIDDWRLKRDGTLDVASLGSLMDWTHGGRLGNWLTVNGKSSPTFNLNAGEAYRLRLINASNARTFNIDPNRFDATVIGYDGQALDEPIELNYSPLLLGSAQRVDLLVIPKVGADFAIEEISSDNPYPFVHFKVEGKQKNTVPHIRLTQNDLPEPDLSDPKMFKLSMSGGAMGNGGKMIYNGKTLEGKDFQTYKQFWAFNGVANLAEAPFFSIQRGETVVIDLFNNTAFMHGMHVHGHHFRVLHRAGSSIKEGNPWRDTFMIGSTQTTRIAFVADNPGKWLLHCHMLEHAAAGMTTWFEVT
ncbi:MAG: multicopper oxidase family protein [Rhizobiaceae bacterium]